MTLESNTIAGFWVVHRDKLARRINTKLFHIMNCGMIKLTTKLSIISMLLVTISLSFAQESCGYEEADTSQHLLLVIPTNEEQQIWRYSFLEDEAIDTGIRIPISAFQLTLSPNSNQLAYRLIETDESVPNGREFRIMVLDLGEDSEIEVFAGSTPNITQVVDLRWIDEKRIGFVSSAREQQYTIIDIDRLEAKNHRANIPIPVQETRQESARGDWHIEYNSDFSRGAFMNFRDIQVT